MNSKAAGIRRYGIVGNAAMLLAIATTAFGTRVATANADDLSADFPICGEERRVNCVVDGDTFWFSARKFE